VAKVTSAIVVESTIIERIQIQSGGRVVSQLCWVDRPAHSHNARTHARTQATQNLYLNPIGTSAATHVACNSNSATCAGVQTGTSGTLYTTNQAKLEVRDTVTVADESWFSFDWNAETSSADGDFALVRTCVVGGGARV
jgi:hypothetical protein